MEVTCIIARDVGAICWWREPQTLAEYCCFVQGEFWPPLPSLIYAAFSITAGVLTLFLPETLGKSLQETMDEAEARNRWATPCSL